MLTATAKDRNGEEVCISYTHREKGNNGPVPAGYILATLTWPNGIGFQVRGRSVAELQAQAAKLHWNDPAPKLPLKVAGKARRTTLPEPLVQVSFRITASNAAWLRSKPNQNSFLRDLLNAAHRAEGVKA